MYSISVDDLHVDHRLGRGEVVHAVRGLDLTASAGEVLVVLGPNGAGKTSTLDVIVGLRRPTAGTVTVLGLDPWSAGRELAPRMGVMPQDGGIQTGIRPPEVLRAYAGFWPSPADPDELLERVGLAHARRTTYRRLSGGEKQRLSLALALIGRPEVVLLDEPTAGVDVAGRRVIREIVRELRDGGAAVLLTTHELDEAERMADRIAIVDRGRLVTAGTADELRAGSDDVVRFSTPAELDAEAMSSDIGRPVARVGPGEYEVAAAPSPDVVAAVTSWLASNGIALGELRAGRQRLEDIFLALTGDGDDHDGAAGSDPGAPTRSGRGRRRGSRR
ncbi:MAG: ABC transporter ATP-binding protein [Actinomycetota bacterium]|nr:ABC transporter ATP-binding protein [Actinomycetota bacterium]